MQSNVKIVLVLKPPQFQLVLASAYRTWNSTLASQSTEGPCCIDSQKATKRLKETVITITFKKHNIGIQYNYEVIL
jgi:hypothetical protein